MLRQFVARQRRDAETIAALPNELPTLQVRNEADAVSGRAAKFRRLKLKFSKRFHPDTSSASAAECERPARVFEEFWPVLEEIARSWAPCLLIAAGTCVAIPCKPGGETQDDQRPD